MSNEPDKPRTYIADPIVPVAEPSLLDCAIDYKPTPDGPSYKRGLYCGTNLMPRQHRLHGVNEAAQIQRLDKDGKPSDAGLIGMVSFGSSVAHEMMNGALVKIASIRPLRDGLTTIDSTREIDVLQLRDRFDPVNTPAENNQVQIAFMCDPPDTLAAVAGKAAGPKHFENWYAGILAGLKMRFPNLRVCFATSTYRRFAVCGDHLSDMQRIEFESGIGLQRTIMRQVTGDPLLRFQTHANWKAPRVPWIGWAGYSYATEHPRAQDGLKWGRSDLESDGKTPTAAGMAKLIDTLTVDWLNCDVAHAAFTGKVPK